MVCRVDQGRDKIVKEYFMPSKEDIANRRLDRRLFTDNYPYPLEFVKDDSKLTISNDAGESWEFPYETNRIFELDNDKRYVMLIEERGYARLLASAFLAVKESPRMVYPGLTHVFFEFIGLFEPECIMEDKNGTVYTAEVARYKGEYIFEDDEFHRKVVDMCGKAQKILDEIPSDPEWFRVRNRLNMCVISTLEQLDRRGDPTRFMPPYIFQDLYQHRDVLTGDLGEGLAEEFFALLEEYKKLKRI